MSLSRQSIALVLTTKNKETKHHIHPKHETNRKRLPQLTKQTTPCFGTPFTTFRQEMEQVLFLQPGAHMRPIEQGNTITILWHKFSKLLVESTIETDICSALCTFSSFSTLPVLINSSIFLAIFSPIPSYNTTLPNVAYTVKSCYTHGKINCKCIVQHHQQQ